jgi:hypothetical protein
MNVTDGDTKRNRGGLEFLLVARHADDEHPEEIEKVARRLISTLKDLDLTPWAVRLSVVEHSGRDDAKTTALEITSALAADPDLKLANLRCEAAEPKRALGPTLVSSFAVESASEAIKGARDSVDQWFAKDRFDHAQSGENSILLVGNQPAIDCFLNGWVDETFSIAKGELVCLARRRAFGRTAKRWHLWWVITPKSAGAIDALREKIASKITVLGVLAGFTVALLGSVLVDLPDQSEQRTIALLSCACLATAAILFVGALLAYDQLMMPHRFWRTDRREEPGRQTRDPTDRGPVWRPPSSAGWILYQESIRLWGWVVGALIIAGVATWLLVLSTIWPIEPGREQLLVLFSAVLPIVLSFFWWKSQRPQLGTED